MSLTVDEDCDPKINEVTLTLHNFLENIYQKAGKRTRRALTSISLNALGWNNEHIRSFQNCKEVLAHQCTLVHRDESKRLCLFTDANDNVWSGILTQVPHSDTKLPFKDQRHEPLGFLSGRFNATQSRWAIIEKEAFAVMACCERMRWLLATTDGFDLYTDHNNLIFIFDPLSIIPDLTAGSVRKVLRWAVSLSWFNYVCYHISGQDNVWADLIGRWSPAPTVRRLASIPALVSTSDDDF